jgi:nucleoside-diphosphate-sugar epimerase
MYLVTGGAGFVGSHIVEALVKRGEHVRVVDNFSTGKMENLAGFREAIELLAGDVADPNVAEAAVAGIDVVFHQAALPSVPRSIADPLLTHNSNVTGTLQLLHAAQRAGVRRFVYAASSSAYGDTPTLPKVETMIPRPRSPYAVAKLSGEQYCQAFFHVHGLETVCLRYFNIFGMRQDPESAYAAVIPRWIECLMHGRAPIIFGDGGQSRDFTFVANAVDANLLAAEAPDVGGQVFNIGCGQRVTLNRLLEILQSEVGKYIKPQHQPARPGDVRDSLADIEKARKHLGYQPRVPLTEGIAQTVESFRHEGLTRRAA